MLLFLWMTGLFAQDTTILLVRHAEKVSEDADALLSEAGHARARALVPVLAGYHPTALFASSRRRTQETLEPLAKALNLQIQIHPPGEWAALAKHLLEVQRGRTVVVAWHQDSLPRLAEALGVPGQVWPQSMYGQVWVIHLPAAGGPTLEVKPLP
jgi:phosphohistidine phosphatase SixA